jgi:cell division protein DivIC
MDFVKKIPSWLKSKYTLTFLAFVVWIIFFDHNDFFVQTERTAELRQLEKGKAYYAAQIEEIKKELSGLKNDPASLEKAARERFMMKKDNEDLFIIEEK